MVADDFRIAGHNAWPHPIQFGGQMLDRIPQRQQPRGGVSLASFHPPRAWNPTNRGTCAAVNERLGFETGAFRVRIPQ